MQGMYMYISQTETLLKKAMYIFENVCKTNRNIAYGRYVHLTRKQQ